MIQEKFELVIIPKNSGLNKCKEIANSLVEDNSKIMEVRGEDVPLFVEKLFNENKNAIGITGEDLFKEFSLSNKDNDLKIIKRIIWQDENLIYKKPTLCLLGSKDQRFEDLPKRIKLCINSKYKEIAKKYCINPLENKGHIIEKIYASGATESFFTKGLVDGVIDIVCSGKSAKESNLKVYEKIFESDIVIIGKKDNFDLKALYSKIKDRIENNNESSYTSKLANDLPLLYRKLIEESAEVITAKNRDELIWEVADLIYFLFVIMAKNNISIKEIERENERRNEKENIKNLQGGVIS